MQASLTKTRRKEIFVSLTGFKDKVTIELFTDITGRRTALL